MQVGRIVLAVAGLAAMSAGAAGAVFSDRNALWLTVQSCKAASGAFGLAFPCLEVQPQGSPGEGYAIIRTPLERTHLIATPTRRIPGLESPELRLPQAGDYWRAAWKARALVQSARETKGGLEDIGLAVNSPEIRSQDQFHIHADCIRANVRRALAAQGAALGAAWRLTPFTLRGARFYGRRIEERQLARINPWASLLEAVPALRARLANTGFAILPAPANGREPMVFLLANAEGRGAAEELLDHACSPI